MKKIEIGNYKKPSDFMSFHEGENRIRVVSNGVMGFQHSMKTANRFINLGPCSETVDCPHCKKGYEPKMSWKWIIYDYEDPRVKILEAGPTIGNWIGSQKEEPKDYDIIINRIGK